MPLRDTEALRSWEVTEHPSVLDRLAVELWVLGLDRSPWQPPSVPWLPNDGEPTDLRMAELSDPDIVVMYVVDQVTLEIDLLYVGP